MSHAKDSLIVPSALTLASDLPSHLLRAPLDIPVLLATVISTQSLLILLFIVALTLILLVAFHTSQYMDSCLWACRSLRISRFQFSMYNRYLF